MQSCFSETLGESWGNSVGFTDRPSNEELMRYT